MIFWTVVILAVYLLVILSIGFYSSRGAGKDSESFFVANRHLNWLQESMAVFTAVMPAGALVGTIGLFYRDGANMLGYLIGYSFLMPLTYWYVGSRLRRLGRLKGYQTQAVFIGEFYQSRFLHWGVAMAGIIFLIPYIMVNPVAMGYLLNKFTGIPYPVGILIFVSVSAVYTMKGGLRAVANTDIFHGVLLLTFLLGTIIALIAHAGGLVHVLDTPRMAVATTGPGLKVFMSWVMYMGFTTICWPDRAFRMFAVRDENNMRKGCIISAAMLAFGSISFLLIALAVRRLVPNIANPDTTLASGLQVAALWMVPWFVMNAWGGGMSSFTAGMLSTANIFIKDIYEPLYLRSHNVPLGPKRDKLVMLSARIFMLVLALTSLVCCFYPPPFIWDLINLTHGSLMQFAPMLIVGFLWRGATRLGVQVGWVVGLVCMFMWTFFFKPPYGTLAGLNAVVVNLCVFVVVSLLIPEKKRLKQEREVMRRLAAQDADVLAASAKAGSVTSA